MSHLVSSNAWCLVYLFQILLLVLYCTKVCKMAELEAALLQNEREAARADAAEAEILEMTRRLEDARRARGVKTSSMPYKAPTLNWFAENVYEKFQIFKMRCQFAFEGQFKLYDGPSQVDTMLSWILDNEGYTKAKQLCTAREQESYKAILDKFEEYLRPAKNKLRSWYEFGNLYSNTFKSQNDFVSKLREVSKFCDFTSPDEMMAFMFLIHNNNSKVRDKMIENLDPAAFTLEQMLVIAKDVEGNERQKADSARYVEGAKRLPVDSVHKKQGGKHGKKGFGKSPARDRPASKSPGGGSYKSCNNCGSKHAFKSCPAFGKECFQCHRKGHFKHLCPNSRGGSGSNGGPRQSRPHWKENRRVNEVEQEYRGDLYFDSEYVDSIEIDGVEAPDRVLVVCNSQGAGKGSKGNFGPILPFLYKVDSGASANLMPLTIYRNLFTAPNSLEVLESTKNSVQCRLVNYSKEEIEVYGVCQVVVRSEGKRIKTKFFVVPSQFKPLLGVKASLELGILDINVPYTSSWDCNWVDSIQKSKSPKLDPITVADLPAVLSRENIVSHPKVKVLFSGVGRFKRDPVHITLRGNYEPVQKAARRVPIAVEAKFKAELDSMVAQGILSPYLAETGSRNLSTFRNAPEWLNSFVIVRKPNGDIRVCLDPTDLNKAIVRPVCNSHTIDDVVHLLRDAKYFAVFDGTKGFFHVPLDEESKRLTAMLTPFGIYYYNVLAMGLADATDIFEQCMRDALKGLKGVTNIADDVLVYAKTEKEFRVHLCGFLNRCVAEDLHLNPTKVQINVESVPFFGMRLTKEGLEADPKKQEQIKNWPVPKNVTELQSFLGMVNYLSRFLPYLSAMRSTLGQLLKKESAFVWAPHHQETFLEIKKAVAEKMTLAFFRPEVEVFIECDASKKGIGAVMLQPDPSVENTSIGEVDSIPTNLRPVSFASKTLSGAESRYSNIERELLGVVFSVLHFKHFTYGRQVVILTDHKPLLTLMQKNLSHTSPRLARMLLQILDYNIVLRYQPGNKMYLSDFLSRLSSHGALDGDTIPGMDIQVHDVSCFNSINLVTIPVILRETERDPVLKLLKQYITDGFPAHSKSCAPAVRHYYSYRDDLSCVDGLILKNQQIVIPEQLRESVLLALHSSHMGICKSVARAKTSVFWPEMSKQIEKMIAGCRACLENQSRQQHESSQSDLVVQSPWSSISLDNFEIDGNRYLMILCRFSRFMVVRPVTDFTASTTKSVLLDVFSELGLPASIRTDRGRNFVSVDFMHFCKDMGMSLQFSSAYHHASNPAERAIRTVKGLMKKASSAKQSWRLALMEYLATPLSGDLGSPSYLMGRQFHGMLPYRSITDPGTSEKMEDRHQRNQVYYDRQSKDLSDLAIGETVGYFDHVNSKWQVGKVSERQGKSYTVFTEKGTEISRNRVDLRPTLVKFSLQREERIELSSNAKRLLSLKPASKKESIKVNTLPKVPEALPPPAVICDPGPLSPAKKGPGRPIGSRTRSDHVVVTQAKSKEHYGSVALSDNVRTRSGRVSKAVQITQFGMPKK